MKGRRPFRLRYAGGVLLAIALLGAALQWPPAEPGRSADAGTSVTAAADAEPDRAPRDEVDARFQQAIARLRAGQPERARVAWERVLALAPHMPEAHVNLGFTLTALGDWGRAHAHFQRALALRPEQANGYYGLALCHEHEGDIEAALGAMRTYIHLADDQTPHVRRALAALWEWQAARGPTANLAVPSEASREAVTAAAADTGTMP